MFGLSTFSGLPFSSAELGGFFCDVSELTTGSDTVSSSVILLSAVEETTTGLDAVSSSVILVSGVEETAAGSEALTTIAVYNIPISDSAVGADAVIGAYLWNPIDSAQTPNWQKVNT